MRIFPDYIHLGNRVDQESVEILLWKSNRQSVTHLKDEQERYQDLDLPKHVMGTQTSVPSQGRAFSGPLVSQRRNWTEAWSMPRLAKPTMPKARRDFWGADSTWYLAAFNRCPLNWEYIVCRFISWSLSALRSVAPVEGTNGLQYMQDSDSWLIHRSLRDMRYLISKPRFLIIFIVSLELDVFPW